MMRLDKYLAERTGMTRSESRKAITKGRVAVNGVVCRKADTQVVEDCRHCGGWRTAGRHLPKIRVYHAEQTGRCGQCQPGQTGYHGGGPGWRNIFPGGRCSRRDGWIKPAPVLFC